MNAPIPRSRPALGRNVAALPLAALTLLGSAHEAAPDYREVVLQVHGLRAPCTGVAPMSCLQVRRGRDSTGDWQYFYAGIEGFTHEAGYRYLIRVRETESPREQVPADASSIQCQLLEVLEKTPEP